MSEGNIPGTPSNDHFPKEIQGEVDTTQHSPLLILALAALSSPINPAEIPRASKKIGLSFHVVK